jgi:hypothetical protein
MNLDWNVTKHLAAERVSRALGYWGIAGDEGDGRDLHTAMLQHHRRGAQCLPQRSESSLHHLIAMAGTLSLPGINGFPRVVRSVATG